MYADFCHEAEPLNILRFYNCLFLVEIVLHTSQKCQTSNPRQELSASKDGVFYGRIWHLPTMPHWTTEDDEQIIHSLAAVHHSSCRLLLWFALQGGCFPCCGDHPCYLTPITDWLTTENVRCLHVLPSLEKQVGSENGREGVRVSSRHKFWMLQLWGGLYPWKQSLWWDSESLFITEEKTEGEITSLDQQNFIQ